MVRPVIAAFHMSQHLDDMKIHIVLPLRSPGIVCPRKVLLRKNTIFFKDLATYRSTFPFILQL